ncbi:MAG: bifunctional folylpolyglutamate synthase/dihydrofolate synthase, partial [Pseudomonadota bacterium]
MRFSSLAQWLEWQESLHPSAIDLGLERPGKVLKALGLASPGHTVITVAGTNGKGSSVAMLESILLAAGYRVGAYTSPHLLRYNERIRINGEPV